MVNKKLVTLACIVFAVGLSVGVVSLNGDLRNYGDKEYPVEVDFTYAYFKVFNASADSGIAYNQLVAYVFIFNVTNPSDAPLYLSRLNVIELGHGGAFEYLRDFAKNDRYRFEPNASNLLAVSQISGLMTISGESSHFRNNAEFTGVYSASFKTQDGVSSGGAVNNFDIHLTQISPDEYVYGSAFNSSSLLYFDNNNGFISAWPVTGLIG